MAETTKKYLSLDKLQKYDVKIKEYIDTAEADALAASKQYFEDESDRFDVAGAAATAKSEAIAHADSKDAAIAEAKKAGDDAAAALDAYKTANDKAVQDVQSAVDAHETYVGEIPSTSDAASVIEYINEKTANVADDSTVTAIDSRVTETEKDIAALEGLVGTTKVETQISNAIDALKLPETYDAKGAAAAVQGETTGTVASVEGEVDAAVERIGTLEDQIQGLSGAMHFEGVKDSIPSNVSGYEAGDVIIVGDKEYVFNGTSFVEFGDVSAEGERLTALETHKTAYEAKVNTLETEMDDVQALAAAAATKIALADAVSSLESADSSQVQRIAALEAKHGSGAGTVEAQIEAAKTAAISAAASDATSKANQALADAKKYADDEDAKIESRVAALEAIDHEHENKDLLDTYTQTEANLADAVAKKHEHDNLTVLNSITAANITAWSASEQNAKTYADGINTALTAKIEANTAAINSFVEISEAEINQLFAV